MKPIYLDYNATTPVDPRVVAVMQPYIDYFFGNPSSIHSYGTDTKKAVEIARSQVAALLHAAPDEIIFTSGGTESNNLAIKGVAYAYRNRGNHIITSSVEHPAVTEVCRWLEKNGFEVTYVAVDRSGRIDPVMVEKAIRPDTILISIMHANNETGTIQPVAEIGRIARERHILFHSDAAQSIGKIRTDVNEMSVDLLSVAGHKLYAPKGIGALYIRRGVRLEKLMHGADHESNLRPGTENVIHIAGLGAAATLFTDAGGPDILQERSEEIKQLRDRLHAGIQQQIPEVRLNGHPDYRLPNTLSLGFPDIDAALLLNEMKEVAASAGAACHSDRKDVSGVLAALQVPYRFAMGTIRFSLGRMTTREEVDQAILYIVDAYNRLKGSDGTMIEKDGQNDIKLTSYTHSLGCACKIRPQLLEKILQQIPVNQDDYVLVDQKTSDDAAVYRFDDNRAIVQTVDLIPPVVDDPYLYGAITAANALSDIYAMGAEPVFALSIVAFPESRLPLEVLGKILQGANDKLGEAGIRIIGGHSIEDHEPKLGLVITGEVHPDKIIRNSTLNPGDVLLLTKPLGTGIVTTALKRGVTNPEDMEQATRVMTQLNRVPAEVMRSFQVSACTDITGFGLLGHLKEMVLAAGVRVVINSEHVPVLEPALRYAAAGIIPGGTKNNFDFISDLTQWHEDISEVMKMVLADAQTSGGLLIAIPESGSDKLLRCLHEAGIPDASAIGFVAKGEPAIEVR